MESDTRLNGVRVVSLAINLPGPAAAARLVALGATVVKIEPPQGDPLAFGAPDYYRELAAGQEIVTADLKTAVGQELVWQRLADADLLLTSSRPSALRGLGFDWATVHARASRISQVAIVGYPGEKAETAGHDLTYQAANGSVVPPALPRVLVADLAGAERAAGEAIAALWQALHAGSGCYAEVALSDVAFDLAAPVRHAMTTPDGMLGGASPRYGLYETSDGYVALAALEEHFWRRFSEAAAVTEDATQISEFFRSRTTAAWVGWALERDIPLAAVESG
ncbi:CoA transferase [Calidifontibacter terrae]